LILDLTQNGKPKMAKMAQAKEVLGAPGKI